VEGVSVRLEVHVGRFDAGSFSPNIAYNLCWAGSVPKSNCTNTGFSATTNGCDSSRSKVKWWEITEARFQG
jgi:hypothetical protein